MEPGPLERRHANPAFTEQQPHVPTQDAPNPPPADAAKDAITESREAADASRAKEAERKAARERDKVGRNPAPPKPPASPAIQAKRPTQARREEPFKVEASRVLSILGAIALGALTGLAVAGLMTNPVGWVIAGAALAIGLAGSYYYGGTGEFLKTLAYSTGAFIGGFGGGLMGPGMALPAAAAGAETMVGGLMLAVGGFSLVVYLKKTTGL